ncbi:hypothetical protein ES288_D10G141400v1 [Gossypium darwinii]|uniref:Uncharacterized protein n=1 Tax=Gossypium darwinii TaxID=34276 RepID=A0A5D2AZP7_GOSDA|nr:hypothetical protein ES288_D10G141400v1 [Gossypium darwinii]
MHSPYYAGPPPNGRSVDCNAITGRISSVPITPIGCNRLPHIQRRLGIPYRFLFSITYSALIDFCFFFHRYCKGRYHHYFSRSHSFPVYFTGYYQVNKCILIDAVQ